MTRQNITVLLDCDGVLADFVGAVISNLAPGRTPDEVTEWNVSAALGIAPADLARVVGRRHFCNHIKPYPGARDAVAALRKIADVYVVTAPWPSIWWAGERGQWIVREIGLPRDRVIHTSAKYMVRSDWLLDDCPEHVWGRAGGVLLRRPWNLDSGVNPAVQSIAEFAKLVCETATENR